MNKASKGDWVEISTVILRPEERAPNLPQDTASIPYMLRVRGIAINQGTIGQTITIRTQADRLHTGKLVEVNPTFNHNFGECISELVQTRLRLKKYLSGETM